MSVNAQSLIKNDYSSTSATATTKTTESDKVESCSSMGLSYYSFDGFENWGLNVVNGVEPNGWFFDLIVRAQFKEHGNYNGDLLLNYSFLLSHSENATAFLKIAFGPSLRVQDQAKLNSKGNLKWEEKCFCDAVFKPTLGVKLGKIVLEAGAMYWAPKWKFSKDDGAVWGFTGGIGYAF